MHKPALHFSRIVAKRVGCFIVLRNNTLRFITIHAVEVENDP